MIGKRFLKQLAKDAVNVSKEVVKGTVHVGGEIVKGTVHVGEEIGKGTVHVAKEVGRETSNLFGGNESTGWDLAKLPEEQRLAFYGALFAIASADGHFDKDEMDLICGIMDLDGMSDHAKDQIQEYIIEPPNLFESLQALNGADMRHYAMG